MTLIQVNPALLNNYGSAASGQFETMAGALGNLVNDVNSLQYAGANAKQFKDQCSVAATDYVNFMNKTLTQMVNAIGAATRNIEQSLGGAQINVNLSEVAVATSVEDAGGDVVVLDQAALETTKSNIIGYFGTLTTALSDHQAAFNTARTEWQGNAAEVAQGVVDSTTRSALDQTEQVRNAITGYMSSQGESADSADKSLQVG